MIKLEDLTEIPEDKKNLAVKCLDELLTFRDKHGRLSPVITGYNFYNSLPKSESVVTLSHIHETEAYKQDMLRSLGKLGYSPKFVLECLREKTGVFLWNPIYRTRNDKGQVLSGLRIKDLIKGKYINLTELFLEKSGIYIYDERGIEIKETEEERTLRNPWNDAYETPVLILGERALECIKELPHFEPAVRIYLAENNNEICFVIK